MGEPRAGEPVPALSWRWSLAIFALALALRLAYLGQAAADPSFDGFYLDALWHLQQAKALAHGQLAALAPFYRPPLYPLVLAGLLLVTGGNLLAVRLVQLVIGSVTAVLVGLLGARMFGRRVGAAAGLLYAGVATILLTDFELLSPVILLPLVVCGLLAFERAARRPSLPAIFVLGLTLGLAAVARPDILPFVPVAALLVAYSARHAGWSTGGLAKGAGVLALGVALPIAPVTAVNAVFGHDLVLICSNGGVNLYLGNNPDADGCTPLMPGPTNTASYAPDGTYTDNVMSSGRFVAREALGHEPRPSEVSAYWVRRVLEWVRSAPVAWARLTLRKAFYVAGGFEIGDTKNLTYFLDTWWPFAFLPRWWWLAPLAAAGLTIAGERRARLLLAAHAATYAAAIVAFLVVERYRLVLYPALAILGARFLVWVPGAVRARRWRALVPRAVLVGLLIAVTMWDPIGYSVRERVASRITRGAESERSGNDTQAERLLLDAMAISHGARDVRLSYAAFLERHGRHAEALAIAAPALAPVTR